MKKNKTSASTTPLPETAPKHLFCETVQHSFLQGGLFCAGPSCSRTAVIAALCSTLPEAGTACFAAAVLQLPLLLLLALRRLPSGPLQ